MYNDPDLSVALKKEVAIEMVNGILPLRQVPILAQCSDECLAELISHMKLQVFMPRDYVCSIGDPGRCAHNLPLAPNDQKDGEENKGKENKRRENQDFFTSKNPHPQPPLSLSLSLFLFLPPGIHAFLTPAPTVRTGKCFSLARV